LDARNTRPATAYEITEHWFNGGRNAPSSSLFWGLRLVPGVAVRGPDSPAGLARLAGAAAGAGGGRAGGHLRGCARKSDHRRRHHRYTAGPAGAHPGDVGPLAPVIRKNRETHGVRSKTAPHVFRGPLLPPSLTGKGGRGLGQLYLSAMVTAP